ncbi:N-acetylglucosamine-specific PTS transporter subunit IIBC [Clostridium sp. KNHs216]|uniref:N-acetylglucosamine-specific PTS transporter subunit IIBC n=1 Tax=Clostridium sp. KNHs216 TaxID=1550235 RepID=UPI001150F0E7|nr:N-acetylglucosamine-specific PTS transporter subunit IIBC [Clostridium sp. KNHs216]TQI68675.1 PTS system N-acetylglucosamine-specific IIB component (Glc family) /PTS system N-acetylglucosamine-specific IIC component (Glc family) [Clostridium sp. KNHs216]
MQKVLAALQKLGKALMLPIASLPIAGLLLRLGQSDMLNIPLLADSGNALFSNLPLLFAIGIAVGLAKDNNGAAGLAGAVAYFVLNAAGQAVNHALQIGSMFMPAAGLPEGITEINMAHFGGIIAGVIAGLCYNRFHSAKLPDWLAFFGGRRFVPIVTGGFSLVIGGLLGTVWPTFQKGLDAAANWMTGSGGLGEFIYGTLNRLLLPFGLHHVVNTAVWFNFGTYTGADGKTVSGDLWRFFAGDPHGGVFTAGFFPIMMFALPAAALAMYVCAKKENKAIVGGALFSVALTAFLTGVTEPIEFMFMFLAPVLFVLHAALTGLSLVVCNMLGIRDSFTFSAGLFDYLINWTKAANGWMIIPVGLVFAVVYFFLFVFFIKKFNLKTPGREDDEETSSFSALVEDQGFDNIAKKYIAALGGAENIKEIDSCITRIRLTLVSNKELNEKDFKALGASGVMKAGTQVTQVIVGTKAELLVDAMKKYLPGHDHATA